MVNCGDYHNHKKNARGWYTRGMATREKHHALVFSRRHLKEADSLITFLTREAGLIRVEARGVRRIPSRRGGHLEPLTHVLLVVSQSHEYWYLAGTETLDHFPDLHHDPAAQAAIQRLAQLIRHLIHEREPHPELFDAMKHACALLPTLTPSKRHILEVSLSLYILERAGVQPALRECLDCGTKQPHDAIVLDSSAGGWRCLSCHPSLHGAQNSLPPRLLKVLRWLATSPQRALLLSLTDHESEQLVSTMRLYLATIVGIHTTTYAT